MLRLLKSWEMSRIGNNPVSIPQGVDVNIKDNEITVKGKLGELTQTISNGISVKVEDNAVVCERASDSKDHKAQHGLMRSLVNNMIEGVSKGWTKELELVGVGYRAALKGKQLNLQLGYSHDINYDIPDGIKIEVEKQTTLKISGSDKQQVGSVASKIKTYRKIEPYKGKGIREKGQYVLKKEGKKK